MARPLVSLISLTALMFAVCATASAQTHFVVGEVTGGSFDVDTSTSYRKAGYDLQGSGFHFVTDAVEFTMASDAVRCFDLGCRPGDVVDLSNTFQGSYLGVGLAVVGEESLSPAYFSGGVMILEADPVTIPRGNRKHLVLTSRFSLVGFQGEPAWLRAESGGFSGGPPPWLDARLTGSGTATAFFRRDRYPKRTGMPEQFYYVLVRVVYSFHLPST